MPAPAVRFPLAEDPAFGCGLRHEHLDTILETKPPIDTFEVLADNFLNQNGAAFEKLLAVSQLYPICLHSVGLSIASFEALDPNYVTKLKSLARRLNATTLSDHLCWSHAAKHYTHELMPFPYTLEALNHIATKVIEVQQQLEQPLMLENISRYVSYTLSACSEAEFLNKLCEKTGSQILLDINNLYVNQINHNESARQAIDTIHPDFVAQFHLGGHRVADGYVIDDHGDKVCDAVWDLYHYAVQRFPNTTTIVEWDNQLPAFDTLLQQVSLARLYANQRLIAESYE